MVAASDPRYEKSDQALTLANQYLAKLFELEQYAAQYNLSVDQMNSQLDQWYANYLTQLRQMDISADQWNQQMAFQREQYDYQKAQDAKSWDWKAREYADSRADTAWQQGMTERQYADNRADTAWQQGMTERQYADSRADTAWQQGLTERQYAANRADTAWQQGLTERQYADNRADTAWQKSLEEQKLADSRAESARKSAEMAKQQAYNDCITMLNMGVMPDAARLNAAGISRQEAELWVSAIRVSNEAKQTASGSSGSSGTTQSMTRATAEWMAKNGQWSDTMYDALLRGGYKASDLDLIYHDSEEYQKYMKSRKQTAAGTTATGTASGSGSSSSSGRSRSGFEYDAQRIEGYLNAGNTTSAVKLIDSIWPSLTDTQKNTIQTNLTRYGVRYQPG